MILYLVVPCYNEEEGIEHSAHVLRDYMNLLTKNGVISGGKIVLVNDGSADHTEEILEKLHREDTIFSVISFSRNYGHQYAVMAGYEFSANKCDVCISIDADLQQDIHAIPEFIKKYREGNEIVFGVRNTRDTDGAFKKMSSQMFYKLMKAFGCNIIPNHADYRLLSNKALNALKEYGERTVFLRGMVPSMGFKSEIVYFDVSERMAGESKYTLKKMLNLALDGITSYSEAPMRILTGAGFAGVVIGVIGLIISAILALTHHNVGLWGIAMLGILLTGVVLTSNGIVGFYVLKTYMESKHRPRYIIDQIKHEE